MTICRLSLLIGLSLICLVNASDCNAEMRFGPWAYYAPYYFPQNVPGCPINPVDQLPTYESPNPPLPSHDPGPCAAQAPPRYKKVSSGVSSPASQHVQRRIPITEKQTVNGPVRNSVSTFGKPKPTVNPAPTGVYRGPGESAPAQGNFGRAM